MLVTYHNAFAYFAERYGFTTAEFLVNHPDREPTAQDMVNLIRLLRGVSRPVVFAEPQFGVGQRYVKSIAGEIGGEVHVLYSATLTSEIPSYIDLMRYNGQVLLKPCDDKQTDFQRSEIKNLTAGYSQVPVIENVDWRLAPGSCSSDRAERRR